MNKIVQLSNLTDDKYRKLEVNATSKGLSVADYVSGLIDSDLESWSNSELLERLKTRKSIHMNPSAAETIRLDRDSR